MEESRFLYCHLKACVTYRFLKITAFWKKYPYKCLGPNLLIKKKTLIQCTPLFYSLLGYSKRKHREVSSGLGTPQECVTTTEMTRSYGTGCWAHKLWETVMTDKLLTSQESMTAESKFDTLSFGSHWTQTISNQDNGKANAAQPDWRQKNCKTGIRQDCKKVAHKINGCVCCKCYLKWIIKLTSDLNLLLLESKTRFPSAGMEQK